MPVKKNGVQPKIVKADLTGPVPRRFRHKQGAVFGTASKKDKAEMSPGPGAYEPSSKQVQTKSREALILSSEDRHSYIQKSAANLPGPGQYTGQGGDLGHSASQRGVSRGGVFDQSARKTEFEKVVEQTARIPGPAEYSRVESAKNKGPSFGKNVKGAAGMGSKHKPEKNNNPGPGQYSSDKVNMMVSQSNCKIGTAKRVDLWVPDGKNSLQTPGPGSHSRSYSSFANQKKINFGSGRKESRNDNPGPGHYNAKSKEMMNDGKAARIGSQSRPELFQGRKDLPGPGNYAQDTNTFGKSVKGAAGMGSKFKPEVNQNPGPGQYANTSELTKSNSQQIKLGTAAREDLWKDQSKQDLPGPGNYTQDTNTFGKSVKGAAGMGSKYKPEMNANPGPGQYSNEPSQASKAARIGSAQRQELWNEKQRGQLPGPGNYVSNTNTFGLSVKGAASMGSKFKPEVNQNPGPGQYSVNDSPTKQSQGSVRMSRAERQELWNERKGKELPGPGNYTENTSSFSHIKGGATSMGSKFKPESNLNPGPGQYTSALNDMSNHQTVNVKIGTQKVRADLFGTDSAAQLPGPGAYESPEKKGKSFVMGGKQQTVIQDTPGPGNYNADSELTRQKESSACISQAKREDIWAEAASKADLPGPGAVDAYDPSQDSKGVLFDKNQRFPEKQNMAPGPGSYELLDY